MLLKKKQQLKHASPKFCPANKAHNQCCFSGRVRIAAGGAKTTSKQAPVPAGHRKLLSKDKPCFILYEAAAMRTITNLSPTITIISGTPYSQPDAPKAFIQRYTARWHCAARREIAERSEEAPGAEAAQPSWNVGNGKTQAGCFGGDARGAEKGAQPHNRPRLALAGGGPNNNNEKASVPAGHKNHLSKDKPGFIAPCRPPRRGQNNIKTRPPCPQGTIIPSHRTSPALLSSERSSRIPSPRHASNQSNNK